MEVSSKNHFLKYILDKKGIDQNNINIEESKGKGVNMESGVKSLHERLLDVRKEMLEEMGEGFDSSNEISIPQMRMWAEEVSQIFIEV